MEIELTRRARKKEATKEKIFQAALKLFHARGFDATTVDDIAAAADVAKGTFFNYFPRKEELLAYISEQWYERAQEQLESELSGSNPPSIDRITDIFVEAAAAYEEDRELSRHVIMEWMRRESSGTDATCLQWRELGQHVLGELQKRGFIRRDVDIERAHQVISSVHAGTMMQWVHAPKPPFRLPEELRRRIHLVIGGLGHRKGD
ncbi:MAG TPA: TetR/AcrR family transcriptional regulator [Gemmatimonadales bacterium]|nr:TetR/AcrR family transcriptional regulator [Gemmatimonadales bacterium]